MPAQFTFWALPPLFAALLAVGMARYVWDQRREPGGIAIFAACVAAALWAVLQTVSLSLVTVENKLFVERLAYVPIALSPVLWLAFSLDYSGRGEQLRRWLMGVIYAIPLATIWIVWSGTSIPLFWSEVGTAPLGGVVALQVEYGTWFYVHMGYSCSIALMATALLALYIAQSPRHWWRLIWVLLAPAAVVTLNAVYLLGNFPDTLRSPTAIGVSAAMSTLAFGLVRRGDLDFAPVARSAVVEEMQDCVIVVDRQGRCVDVNRVASDLFNIWPEGDMPVDLGDAWASLLSSEEMRLRHPEPLELTTMDGRRRSFDLTVTRLGARGGRDRSVLVLRDVTETVEMRTELESSQRRLREANERLERLANTDELTGLPNRRSFFKALKRELGRADRYHQPLSVVLLDLDHFKRVNDTWGHPVGDRVLVAAAKAVEGVCRDSDVPGRIGGEELAVLLLQTDSLEAELVAGRIRRRISEVEHLVPGDLLRVTASFGVATSGPDRTDVDSIIASADEALYAAKQGGRNQVVVAADAKAQTAIDFGN